MTFRPAKRKAERAAWCRSCDCQILPGTEMISWYSPRNTGMHIHICIPCAEAINGLVQTAPPKPVKEYNLYDSPYDGPMIKMFRND